ncbi:MAG: PhnD/SsuA/transferrin family substrate-binding protein [Actinomycetales bacterium]|nr:PhnD/SsuA/transferrin family substrate-binding protein [Actinomycetales bacterium]
MADLRFGTYLAPDMLDVYQAITDRVGEVLECSTELVVETDYESCRADVDDVCFVCSLPYVMFEREGVDLAIPVAAPVLAGARYGGRPIYYSDVIVRRDSPVRSFADLRGRSWAYNERLSQSGYGITRYTMVERGLTGGFFGEVVEAGLHEAAIRLVAEGEVDASAIDSQVLEVELRDHPELAARLRVLEALGPSTIQPVAVSRRIDPALRSRIQDALVSMHLDPATGRALARGVIDRFVAVGPQSYDDVRRMVEACERAGYLELR